MVVADPNCTYDDYYYLGDLPIADVSDCLTTGSVDNWGVCISDHNINEVCTVDLAEHIVDEISTCATPCQNTSSAACRICSGVVVIQQIADLMPDLPYAMCGSDYDRETIVNTTWSDVVEAGNISSLYFGVNTMSDSCNYCLSWYTDNVQDEQFCGQPCTDDAESVACYNCLNVWWGSAMAWCGVLTNDEGCAEPDFVGLNKMNPASVKTCMESVVNGDGLVHCLTDGGSVNLTDACATTILEQSGYYDSENCGDQCTGETSIECANCKGANLFYQTFEYDSILNGSCGTEEDRLLIENVEFDFVYTCGATAPYVGAMCVGLTANVSTACMSCLTSRTQHARSQCASHCHDSSSVDCLECVNIGLMGVAAHCNAHYSGSVGITGLSLVSLLAVFVSVVMLA